MEIKQLTYTSLQQGWTVERTLGNVTEAEAKAFSRYAGQCETDECLYAFDYCDGVYILLQSVPSGHDRAGRARFYVHGYVINEQDWMALFSNCSGFLGVDYFVGREDEPLRETVAFDTPLTEPMECAEPMTLMECVYEAIFLNKRLAIRHDEADSALLVKKLMNAVYNYLPLSLRRVVSFGNRPGSILRTVTATPRSIGSADIEFDLTSGKATGIDGRYADFVKKLFTQDKEAQLAKLEKKVSAFVNHGAWDKEFMDKMMLSVMQESTATASMQYAPVVTQLIELLVKGSYVTEREAKAVNDRLLAVIKEKAETTGKVDEKLVEVFEQTESNDLKDTVAAFLAQKYSTQNENTGFMDFFAYEAKSAGLYRRMTQKAIEGGQREFIFASTKLTFENKAYAAFIKHDCIGNAAQIVAATAASMIMREEDRTLFFERLIQNALLPDVMQALLDMDAEEDVFWDWFMFAYSQKEAYAAYVSLPSDVLGAYEAIFYDIVVNHETDALTLLDRVYDNLGAEQYNGVEKNLIKAGHLGLLELFYTNFFSRDAKSTEELDARKEKLREAGIPYEGFVLATEDAYTELCVAKLSQKGVAAGDVLKQIAAYSEGIFVGENEKIETIKKAFWKHFKWRSLSFNSNALLGMELKDNAKSDMAEAVMALGAYLCGKTDAVDAEVLDLSKTALCQNNRCISAAEQDGLLKKLKRLSCDRERIGLDLYILLHYSNRKKALCGKLRLDAQEIYQYFSGPADKRSMLSVEGVFDSLLRCVKKQKNGGKAQKTIDAYRIYKAMEKSAGKSAIKQRNLFYPDSTLCAVLLILACVLLGVFPTMHIDTWHILLQSAVAFSFAALSSWMLAYAMSKTKWLKKTVLIALVIVFVFLQLFI